MFVPNSLCYHNTISTPIAIKIYDFALPLFAIVAAGLMNYPAAFVPIHIFL